MRPHSSRVEQNVVGREAEVSASGIRYAHGDVRTLFSRTEQVMVDRVDEGEVSLWGGHTPLLLPSPDKVGNEHIF